MQIKVETYEDSERRLLLEFYNRVHEESPNDHSISDSKLVRDTQRKLRVALKGFKERCACAKCRYTICEACMGKDDQFIHLRAFFRMIKDAKKNSLTSQEIHDYLKNSKKWIDSLT